MYSRRKKEKKEPREEARLIRYTSGGRRQAQSIIRSQSCLPGFHLLSSSKEDSPSSLYIYIHTRVHQAKSFVKTDLCLTTPKFRQISCVARHLAELCPSLSPSRGDELIESLIALFYLHLGKCYTSRCWLIIRGEKFPFVVSIQAAGFDPKGTVDKSIIKRKERGTR